MLAGLPVLGAAATGIIRSGGRGALGIAGLGAVGFAAHGVANAIKKGTAFTNPMFAMGGAQAYGKRGTDANRLNTNGLVQNMHQNRRKF